MNIPPKEVSGDSLLKIMLGNLVFLYPNHLAFIKQKLEDENVPLTENTVAHEFSHINYIKYPVIKGNQEVHLNFTFFEEHPRPVSSRFNLDLPRRIVFRGPYIQIILEGQHTRPDGQQIEGRLIFEFLDALSYPQANEKAWFIFTVNGDDRRMKMPRIRTTQAFRAFDTHVPSDFLELQPFLFATMREKKLADLLKQLTNDADFYFAVNDERPQNLRRLKAFFATLVPAFQLPS